MGCTNNALAFFCHTGRMVYFSPMQYEYNYALTEILLLPDHLWTTMAHYHLLQKVGHVYCFFCRNGLCLCPF